MTTPLDELHALLTHAGSLLSGDGHIVAPYDLEVSGASIVAYRSLDGVLNVAVEPFVADYARARHVHLINAFGVTLGDSIIGLTALFALKRRHPHLAFTVYRPSRAPRYVQRLYELAAPAFGAIADLPVPRSDLPDDALRIDLGNHLFWPRFAAMPMIDFFLWALGVAPESIAADDKRNRWLADLPLLAAAQREPYVLLCLDASTPVRSIPGASRARIVERLWDEFGLPVLGFGAVDHPRYRDIASHSRDTDAFLARIKHTRYLMTSDTAALHVAAGFDVPTTTFFTTIAPHLRARDYAHCASVTFDLPHLQGMHASARTGDLAALKRVYRDFDWRAMPIMRSAHAKNLV
ncbi:ADP-heptose:LPS heptosyltransferase [Candidatus Burkholderia brachyanthoides]|nr:ADP-heptose:LPS heptosyltransferase [Candidatus Burkholderia brachyanthoides]